MVINLGLATAQDWAGVGADIAAVRAAPAPTVLKAILETAALIDEEIIAACLAAADAGADFVKTSTGFHPSGGATPHVVALMARTVGTRLGLSATRAVLDGLAPASREAGAG